MTLRMRNVLLFLALLGLPITVSAQTYTTSPPPYLIAQNNSGVIINGACIWTYTAGTTNVAATYSDATGTLNSNPIRSDSAGRFTAFLQPGNSYKFVYESACTPPAHGTTLKTADNISAMPPSGVNVDITGTAGETINAGSVAYLSDGSGSKTAGQWFNASSANNYSSSTALAIGVAVSTVTSGNSGSFRVSGRVTGLTSLVVGTKYYASTTGALTATQPGNTRFVGSADSTTSLVVAPNPPTFTPTVLSKTATYTVTTADGTDLLILADATAGAITINLYAVANTAGWKVAVMKTDTSANAVTIDPNSTETVNGQTTYALTGQYQSAQIESNGSAWFTRGQSSKVLQVVNATYGTQTANSSSTYADTGLTLSITPVSTLSKILVTVFQCGLRKVNDTYIGLKLLRGATLLAQFESQAAYTQSVAENNVGASGVTYLDSPASTSSTTYKTQFASVNNIASVAVQMGGCVSSITLMELQQ